MIMMTCVQRQMKKQKQTDDDKDNVDDTHNDTDSDTENGHENEHTNEVGSKNVNDDNDDNDRLTVSVIIVSFGHHPILLRQHIMGNFEHVSHPMLAGPRRHVLILNLVVNDSEKNEERLEGRRLSPLHGAERWPTTVVWSDFARNCCP